jgi:hypothetical protein
VPFGVKMTTSSHWTRLISASDVNLLLVWNRTLLRMPIAVILVTLNYIYCLDLNVAGLKRVFSSLNDLKATHIKTE